MLLAPDAGAPFKAEENVIAGNTLLYGATSGEVYIRGKVGERPSTWGSPGLEGRPRWKSRFSMLRGSWPNPSAPRSDAMLHRGDI